MPLARCREFDDDGKARFRGCPKGRDCPFVHPDQPLWSTAPRRDPLPRKGPLGSGKGRGGPPSKSRDWDRTGSNNIPIGGGSREKAQTDSGWGSNVELNVGSWGGSWGGETSKGDSTATDDRGWSRGWNNYDTAKDDDGGKGKGKGKAKANESTWGGWGQNDNESNNFASFWGKKTSDNEEGSSLRGWGAPISPKTKDNGASGWKLPQPDADTVSKSPAASSSTLGARRASEIDVADPSTKKPRTKGLTIQPPAASTDMDVDSPLTSMPASATSALPPKPLDSPITTFSAGPSIQRQMTPSAISQTSRSASVGVIFPIFSTKEPRSLQSISHKEAKDIWKQYIEHVFRLITTRTKLEEERALLHDYKTAQNSQIYHKVGSTGVNLLEQASQSLKGHVEWRERDFKNAMEKLCDFEEGFEFPMHLLLDRREDSRKMQEQLDSVKRYVASVKDCVDNMQQTVGDIDARTRAAAVPPPTPVPASPVPDEGTKAQSKVSTDKDQEIEDRLVNLEEKASEYQHSCMDHRNGMYANADDAIQEKVEEMMTDSLESCIAEIDDGLWEKADEAEEKLGSLDGTLGGLVSRSEEIYNTVGEVKELVAKQKERFWEPVRNEQRMLAEKEADNAERQEQIDRSADDLAEVWERLHALENSPKEIPDTPLLRALTTDQQQFNQLMEMFVPAIWAVLQPDINNAKDNLKSSIPEIVQTHVQRPFQEFVTMLAPVYKTFHELNGRVDPKMQRLAAAAARSMQTSPQVVEARPPAQVQTSHT